MSTIFEDAFSSGFGSCRGKCHCGRTYFDNVNSGISWDEGEFEELERLSAQEPNKCVPAQGAVSFIAVDGKTFVWGCECQGWKPYEAFIVRHGRQIAAFLRARQAALAKQVDEIEVPE